MLLSTINSCTSIAPAKAMTYATGSKSYDDRILGANLSCKGNYGDSSNLSNTSDYSSNLSNKYDDSRRQVRFVENLISKRFSAGRIGTDSFWDKARIDGLSRRILMFGSTRSMSGSIQKPRCQAYVEILNSVLPFDTRPSEFLAAALLLHRRA